MTPFRPPETRWRYRVLERLLLLLMPGIWLSCQAFTRLVSEALDRPATRREHGRLRLHRAICRLCRDNERHLQRISLLARQPGPGEPPPIAPARLERMRQAMDDATRNGK